MNNKSNTSVASIVAKFALQLIGALPEQPELTRVPFVLGNQYQQLDGTWVRFVEVHNAGTEYETMVDENGVNRYTSRDFGRCTGTAHDYSCPQNTPPMYVVSPAYEQPEPNLEGYFAESPLMRVHLEHLRHCAPSDLPSAHATFFEYLAAEIERVKAV
jgi:hypothetical protein